MGDEQVVVGFAKALMPVDIENIEGEGRPVFRNWGTGI